MVSPGAWVSLPASSYFQPLAEIRLVAVLNVVTAQGLAEFPQFWASVLLPAVS